MSESVRDQVARTLRESGLEPKGLAKTYQKLYPEFFDTVPYPRGFRVLDFSSSWEKMQKLLGSMLDSSQHRLVILV
jgi:hypothetical protein